jgi:hypothetical protein
MPEFPENIRACNGGTDDNRLPPRQPPSENNGHSFPSPLAPGRLDGNKPDCPALR